MESMVVNDYRIVPVIVKDVFETYTYFYINQITNHGVLIDPGAQANKLLSIIQKNGWVIDAILLTHGHFDHLGAVEEISKSLQIPYKIHRNGQRYLEDPYLNLSKYCHRNICLYNAEFLNNEFENGLQVLYTPGHTPDSVVYYDKKNSLAFVGDTIFKESIGTSQYPGGNQQQLLHSILNIIFKLPEDTILFSGHSEWTTVKDEKERWI